MNPVWVARVLFCPRHQDGRAKIEEDGGSAPRDFRQQLLTVARLRGWDEETCQRWVDDVMDRQQSHVPVARQEE